MKNISIFDDLMNMNADEWNQRISDQLKIPIGKIRMLIVYRELKLDVGKLRLHINRNLITETGKEQLERDKCIKEQYDEYLKNTYQEDLKLLKSFVISIKDEEETITSIACTGKIIIGLDFSNSQLEHSYFNHCIFYNCSFSKSNMESTVITSCSFVDCDLDGVDFSSATLGRNTFLGCDMPNTNFTCAIVSDTAFVNCNMDDSDFLQARILYTGFSGCNMVKESFRDTEFVQISFLYCDMRKSSFKNAYIMDGIMTQTNLMQCIFNDFSYAALTVVSCDYDEEYKTLFAVNNLVYNPAIIEWDHGTDKPER